MLEFSPGGYEQLLKAIPANGYRCVGFDAMGTASTTHQIALRHDVDTSMVFAHRMARMEAANNTRSTYFVMLRSALYNLFTRHHSQLLRDMVAMGHAIGLHFDASHVQGPERTQEAWLHYEIETLSSLANAPVTAFSFHQPTQAMIDAKISIPGIVNTYHPQHTQGFAYISDSNRDWRGKNILAMLETGENIQLLTHPMWWMCDAPTTEGCWDSVIALNFERAQEQMLATERAYGPKRQLLVKRDDASS